MNYIKHKNKKYPLKFNYRVIRTIKGKFNIDLTAQSPELSAWVAEFENQEHLFFEMFKEGHRMESLKFDLSLDDIADILSEDHCYADILHSYQKDALMFITPSASKPEGEDKKKVAQHQK